MIAIWIISGIVLIFGLFLLLRVGIMASYGETGATVLLQIGPFRHQLVPTASKQKRKKSRTPKKKKAEQMEKQEGKFAKKGGALPDFRTLFPPILKVLGKLKRKLRIEILELTYISGGSDPAKAAKAYGAVSAGFGILSSLLEAHFDVQKQNFRTGVDFTIQKPVLYAQVSLSLRLGQILSLGISFIRFYLKENEKKKQEVEVKTVESANPV